MTFVLAIFLGLIIAIVGIIIPGMLNMTIAKISIKENQTQALNFAFGAVVIVFFQCFFGFLSSFLFVTQKSIPDTTSGQMETPNGLISRVF